MKLFHILDVDLLMNYLLASDVFDSFYVRQADLCTLFRIRMDGKRNPDWGEEEQSEDLKWKEIKPYVFERIKGNQLPRFLRVELFLPVEEYQSLFAKMDIEVKDLEQVHIKLSYENKTATVTTGISSSTFWGCCSTGIFLKTFADIEAQDYNLSVSTYMEQEDTLEVLDIRELNKQIAAIVARESVLRAEIDKIIAEIEG